MIKALATLFTAVAAESKLDWNGTMELWSPDCSVDSFRQCGLRSTAVEGPAYTKEQCRNLAVKARYAYYLLDGEYCYFFMGSAYHQQTYCGCPYYSPPEDMGTLLPAFNRSLLSDENTPIAMSSGCPATSQPCGIRFYGAQGPDLNAHECREAAIKMGYSWFCLRSAYCYVYFGTDCGCREPNSYEAPASCPGVTSFEANMRTTLSVATIPQQEQWNSATVAMAAVVGTLIGASAVSILRRKKNSEGLLNNDYQEVQ
jgi:hypothetical protein